MICILLGVSESERHWLFEAIEPQFDFGGSRKAALSQLSVEEAGSRMYAYGQQLIASKRAEPTDDMLSVVANASLDDADAPALSDLELYRCRPRSRRSFGGRRRRRPSDAPPHATSRSSDSRSRRDRRYRSGRARPTVMPLCSTTPTSSTSPENPTHT